MAEQYPVSSPENSDSSKPLQADGNKVEVVHFEDGTGGEAWTPATDNPEVTEPEL